MEKMQHKLILYLAGEKGVGKDTLAELLINKYNFPKVSFATKLKKLCSKAFDLPIEYFDNTTLKDELLPKPAILTDRIAKFCVKYAKIVTGKDVVFPKNFKKAELTTPRQIMQIIGTDVFRSWDKNFWINLVELPTKCVVTDARMPNERQYLKSHGGVGVRVKRVLNLENETSKHESECLLGNDSEYDVVVTNDSTKHQLLRNFDIWFYYKYITRRL